MPEVKANLLAALRRLPLFNDLSEQELILIAERVTVSEHERGAIIFSEGDICRELLIVKEGMIKLIKTAPNGRQQLLSVERPGNSLAEIAVFDGGAYPATATTASRTVLLRLDAERFHRVCLEHPEVAMKVVTVLGHRLRRMASLVESLSFSTVRGRLIAYLLYLAAEDGRTTAHGIEFELNENNEELAARLGTVRELVSRNLGRLYGDGLIQMRRRTVTVPSLAALKEQIEPAD